MHLIIPKLWLGDVEDAHNANMLRQHDIGAVMNCTKDESFCAYSMKQHRARVSVDDDLTPKEIRNLGMELPDIVKWIDAQRKANRNVFIHCVAGVQRSACCVAAYLMFKNRKLSVTEAINIVRSKRHITFRPYANFRASLNTFKKHLDKSK